MPITAITNSFTDPKTPYEKLRDTSVRRTKRKSFVETFQNNRVPIFSTLLAALCLGGLCVSATRGKKVINLTTDDVLKQEFEKVISEFPQDINYYKKIATALGLKSGEEYKLSSVVGASQLTSILKKSSSIDYAVGDGLKFVNDFSHKINLYTCTQASNGQMSIKEFLDNACIYANNRAKIYPEEKFVIAITDSDTTLGVQKALELIIQEPYKYRNLRFVPGVEVSMLHKSQRLGADVFYNLMGYSINPFDNDLNLLLKSVRKNRIINIQKFFAKVNEKYPELAINPDLTLNPSRTLRHGVTNNTVNISKSFVLNKVCQLYEAGEKRETIIEDVLQLAENYSAKSNSALSVTAEEFYKHLYSSNFEGLTGIGHFSRITDDCFNPLYKTNKNGIYDVIKDVFKELKNFGNVKFSTCEIDGFEESSQAKELAEFVNKLVNEKEYSLLSTGGTGACGKSIFF